MSSIWANAHSFGVVLMKRICLVVRSEVATDEVDHLFAAADDNHDDRLSHQEIIDNSDTFVGSEATDYGEHLSSMGHIGDEL